jgi:RsmE family RNA methyltransferase
MNLVLLFDEDFVDDEQLVTLSGRRREHIANVHRVAAGDELVVGVAGGRVGTGTVTAIEKDAVQMRVVLDRDPPPPLDVTLVLALPRPKVLNRVVASVASLGVKRLFLINAWRIEKSYWKSPRVTAENLRLQSILGLEQSRDTVLPQIELRRFFREFVEEELVAGPNAFVAHPYAEVEAPRTIKGPMTLVIGPEGGFIEQEIASLQRAGFTAVSLGPRILRVETAISTLIGRMT